MKATITIGGSTLTELPTFVQYNFGTPIQFNMQNNDGSAYSLATSNVRFKAVTEDTSINRLCTISNITSGIAVYTPLRGDFDISGKYRVQVECSSPTVLVTTELGSMLINEAL